MDIRMLTLPDDTDLFEMSSCPTGMQLSIAQRKLV